MSVVAAGWRVAHASAAKDGERRSALWHAHRASGEPLGDVLPLGAELRVVLDDEQVLLRLPLLCVAVRAARHRESCPCEISAAARALRAWEAAGEGGGGGAACGAASHLNEHLLRRSPPSCLYSALVMHAHALSASDEGPVAQMFRSCSSPPRSPCGAATHPDGHIERRAESTM